MILSSVCLSVYNAVHYGAQGPCRGLKVVPPCSYSRDFPIHFFRHFCCRMYRLARIAVGMGCIIWPQHTMKNRTTEISASEIGTGVYVSLSLLLFSIVVSVRYNYTVNKVVGLYINLTV